MWLPRHNQISNLAFLPFGHMQINVWSSHSDDNKWKFEMVGSVRTSIGNGFGPANMLLPRVLPDDESRPGRSETDEKDCVIAQMGEQLAQQGKQLVELAGQLVEQNQRITDLNQKIAEQNQRIADQNQKITDQERENYGQKRQIEEKDQQLKEKDQQIEEMDQQIEELDQQLEQANREVKYLLARATRGEEPSRQDRAAGTGGSSTGEGRAKRGYFAGRRG